MLTEELAKEYVIEWYKLVDGHASIVDLLHMTVGEEFIVRFGEETLDYKGYAEWYIQDIRSFFDGTHHLLQMDAQIDGNTAVVLNHINWIGRSWTPPEAKSKIKNIHCEIKFTIVEKEERLYLEKYEVL